MLPVWYIYQEVDNRDFSTNTYKELKSSPLQNLKSDALFQFIESDLILLDKIMNIQD